MGSELKTLMGELETLVMKEVWSMKRATVHDVRGALQAKKRLAYTTILTTMRNLEKKGFLGHEMDGRSYVYYPLVDEKTVAQSSIASLLDKLFDGSKIQLANALFDEEPLTKQQFETIRKQIIELRKQENNDD